MQFFFLFHPYLENKYLNFFFDRIGQKRAFENISPTNSEILREMLQGKKNRLDFNASGPSMR